MKKNSIKFLAGENLYLLTGLLTTGTILQTFFLEMGLGEKIISYYEAIMLLVKSAAIFLCSGYIEKMSDIKGLYIRSNLIRNVLIIPLLVYCFYLGNSVIITFAIICVIAFISQISFGVQTVASYKYPYHVIDMKNYGSLLSTSSILGHFFAAAFSYLIMLFNEKLGFFNSMRYILLFGVILTLASAFIVSSTETINEHKKDNNTSSVASIFRYKPFYVLFLPNLMRGLFAGVMSVAAIIGYYNKALDSEGAIALVVIIEVASIIGTFIYSRICKKNIDGKIILFFSALTFLSLFFISTSNKYVFLISFFFALLTSSVIDIAIPVAVTKIVDYTHIGRYTALRMLTHTVGAAIGSALIINVIEHLGSIFALISTGLCILTCGTVYYLYFKNSDNIISNFERSES